MSFTYLIGVDDIGFGDKLVKPFIHGNFGT
jgi:hypothetical protein